MKRPPAPFPDEPDDLGYRPARLFGWTRDASRVQWRLRIASEGASFPLDPIDHSWSLLELSRDTCPIAHSVWWPADEVRSPRWWQSLRFTTREEFPGGVHTLGPFHTGSLPPELVDERQPIALTLAVHDLDRDHTHRMHFTSVRARLVEHGWGKDGQPAMWLDWTCGTADDGTYATLRHTLAELERIR